MRNSDLLRTTVLVIAGAFLPSLACAHVGVSEPGGFAEGFAHPASGLDHVCAMVAVGLWAAQMGGRSVWAVPLSFVSVMTLGCALGALGIGLPFVEHGIVLSVLLLGVLIAAAVRLPPGLSCTIVGLFALSHGHSHGAEMPAPVSGIEYAMGFVPATALLHIIGIGFGLGVKRLEVGRAANLAGAIIALCGVLLAAV